MCCGAGCSGVCAPASAAVVATCPPQFHAAVGGPADACERACTWPNFCWIFKGNKACCLDVQRGGARTCWSCSVCSLLTRGSLHPLARPLCFHVTLVVFSSQLCVQLAAARIGVVVVSVDPAVAIGAIPYVAFWPVPKRAAPYEAFLFAHAAQIHP